jgi:hypothetical protein
VNDLEPLAVALKFGFLAVLYLFLLWVTRMALRDLRGTASPGIETGYHEVLHGEQPGATDAFLVVEEGGGLKKGDHFDLFGGVSLGRSPDADIRIQPLGLLLRRGHELHQRDPAELAGAPR